MKLKDLKLSTRLFIGFSVVIISILIIGIYSINKFNQLGDISTKMYDHPLTVSNAVRDIQINIYAMHRTMKDALLAQNTKQLEEIVNIINEREKQVLASFEIVFERFLGDPTDVHNAHMAFIDWKTIRDEVIQLVQSGENKKAVDITIGKGADHVVLLFDNAQKMVNFASERAVVFLDEADDLRKSIIKNAAIVAVIALLLSLFIAILIIRSIAVPINQVINKMKRISKDQYGHEISIDDSNQIAMLESSVDELDKMGKKLTLEISGREKIQTELGKYKDQLEILVEERTKELEKSNGFLKVSEERLNSFMESATEGFVLLDSELNLIEINKKALEVFPEGIKKKDMIGMNMLELSPGLKETGRYDQYLEVIKSGKPLLFDDIIPHEKFGDKHLSVRAFKVGEGLGLIFADITERTLIEKELQSKQDMLEKAQQIAHIGSWEMDTITKTIVWSKQMYDLLEVSTDQEPTFELYYSRVHPDDLVYIKEIGARVYADNKAALAEYRLLTPSGIIKYIATESRQILDEKNNIIKLTGIVQDITEKKKAEESLKESEEKLKLSLKSAGEGMWEWDFTTDQAYFDDVCLKMLGYNPGEIQKKSEWWWTQWYPDDVAPTKKAVKDYLEGRAKKYSVEFRVRNKSGKYVWIFSNGIVLRKDENNKPLYMIGIHQDITERKKAEDGVLKSRGELRKLTSHLQTLREEERTSISRELHDDLGQNLAILKINMHMLGKDVPKDQKPILDGLESMMELTDHMADSVGKLMEELRPPLLDELGLLGAIKWYQGKLEEYTEIKCEFHIEPEKVDMSDDHNLAVFRILQESLTNVRRHSEATRVKVNLREKNGKLELIVKDNGIGITDQQVREPKAFGVIGMEERVRHLGGELKIEGVAGKGTTVTVRIPLQNKAL